MGVSAIPPDRQLIIWHPAETPPAGYIKANGATLSRDVYAWLFSKIGTAFGAGDGVTTFAIPDLRGEFLRGLDDGRGVDAGRVVGSVQGHAVRQSTLTNIVRQYYAWPAASGEFQFTEIGGAGYAQGSGGGYGTVTFGAGGETRPRNVAGLFCIAYAP